jgi:hypothetical protein
MRNLLKGALLAASLTISFNATAQTTTSARDLFDVCTRADMDWINFCNGFIQAAADSATLSGLACIPAETTRTEIVQLFEFHGSRTMVANPGIGDQSGLDVTIAIISALFPCEQSQ